MKRKLILLALISVLIFCAVLLASSSHWLLVPIDREGSMPLGTLVTWLGLIVWPTLVYMVFFKRMRGITSLKLVYKTFFPALIIIAVLWGPVSYLLAGNWAFNFTNAQDTYQGSSAASALFWKFSYTVAAMPLLMLIVYFVHMRLAAFILNRKRKAEQKRSTPHKA